MPAPVTVNELLDLVQKSGVADEAKLKAYLAKQRDQTGIPTEPSKYAGILVRDGILTYFQAEQLLQGKYKRFSIGKYKVLERLGAGGMGQVFLCEHKLMRRRVAVKVLPTAKAQDEASLGRFYREARAVAAVDHPNIVRAYDIDQDDNLHFLVMEYVDGTNLQDLVKKFGPVDVQRACHYIYASAVGLQHAHEIGLVHRDIKPGNILLDRSGVVKLLDMGLARFFHDSEDNLTKQYDENILGTADYLSPEQAEDSHTVDIRTDIYSLGATFYFLLTGSQPFPEGTIPQKLIWHRSREPRAVRDMRPEVPEVVAAVVAKMMAKKPDDRYQLPADVMAALAPWVTSPIPPPPEREMPLLSPAVAGTASAGSGRPPSSHTGPRSVMTSNPFTSGGTGSASSLPTVVAPGGTPSPATQAAVGATTPARPVAPPPPPPEPTNGVWESLGDGATAAYDDTARPGRTPVPEPRPIRQPATGPRKNVLPLAFAGVGGFVLLVTLAVGIYFLFIKKKPEVVDQPPPTPVGAKRLIVSKATPAAENTYRTLAAAIAKAGPGDTISITESTLSEPTLKIDHRDHDITIESGLPGGKPVVIEFSAPAGGAGTLAMIQATTTENLKLRNLELDGKGVAEVGVVLSGKAPGTVLENVTVRSVTRMGFHLLNAEGQPSRPVLLDRPRIVFTQTCEAGVKIEAQQTLSTRHIAVRNGRFEGQPKGAGIRIEGVVSETELTGNRLFRLDAGVSFGRAPEGQPVQVRIVQNTFVEARAGLLFTPPPKGGVPGKFDVSVIHNYFGNVKGLVQADGGQVNAVTFADNGQNADVKSVGHPATAVKLPNPLPPTNPADDATFLRFRDPGPVVNENRVGAH